MGILETKVIVVTGAGQGLGAAYAFLAAQEGAVVMVNDIDADKAAEIVGQIRDTGANATAFAGDIGDWDVAQGMIATAIRTHGKIDGLINNAGLFHMATPETESQAQIDRIIRVNVSGALYCGLAALRHFRDRGQGVLLNVTSGAHAGMAGMAVYGATKGAVASLTYGWAADVAGTGVRVNAISPIARTRMYDEMLRHGDPRQVKGGLDVTPEDNAAVAIYLLSDKAGAINGQIIRSDPPQLSLMSHPGALSPLCDATQSAQNCPSPSNPKVGKYWDFTTLDRLFQDQLMHQMQPLGVQASGGAL